MTKERREDLLLIAIIVSVAFHAGLMFLVHARVMTHVERTGLHERRRETVRISDYDPADDPVRIEMIKDIMSAREAPKAEASEPIAPSVEKLPDGSERKWDSEAPVPEAPDLSSLPTPAEQFEFKPLKLEESLAPDPLPTTDAPYIPPSRSLTAPPLPSATDFVMPVEFGAPEAKPVEVPKIVEAPVERARIAAPDEKSGPKFVPAQEVYDKVDEKIVEREKEAVRELMDVAEAAPLEKFVNLSAATCSDAQWRYFKLMVSPRSSLPVVPKDVVILLDASGSIGAERLASCRVAAKNALRTALNSGDRFNLVAFRNSYSYAFKRWQDCTQESFDAADKWLASLAAHGRTDVFGTIRSVLTLPRDPARPLIALVVTDGDANSGISDTAQILSKFTDLNDGLVSVYMYGVKESANRELIDMLTRANRGESHIHTGLRWKAGSAIGSLTERFRDPVLSDIRVIFASDVNVVAYPRLLRNLYRGDTVTVYGRVPKDTTTISFSLKGLSGQKTYEAFFKVALGSIANDPSVAASWAEEAAIEAKLK